MEFGFTNDSSRFAAAVAWREAAIADGWVARATYEKHEGIDRACTLEREGFVAMILTRQREKPNEKWAFEAKVSVWGPDRLAIRPPDVYSWETIVGDVERCGYCRKPSSDIQAVGFAGRCCPACLPEQRKRQEYPGWTE